MELRSDRKLTSPQVRMITGLEPGDLKIKTIEYMRDFGQKYAS